jgi:hypothetical protein
VRALLASTDDLTVLSDTAEVVVDEACRLVPSDAGCVLVRDGSVFRVASGRGMRPLEQRLILEPGHWLVRQVSESFHGVLLSGGQGRWAELYGAPLSSREYLLATPLAPLGAILVLGRDDEEFTEPDLESLLELADEAGHLLSDAVDVRTLARALSHLTDPRD